MREFTEDERKFIMEHESNYSLQTLAKLFHCTWQEVYEAYTDTFENGEHKRFMFNNYCKSLRSLLKQARNYSNETADIELEKMQEMTAQEIDKAIDSTIQHLITSLNNSKRRLHENFSEMNKGVKQ